MFVRQVVEDGGKGDTPSPNRSGWGENKNI